MAIIVGNETYERLIYDPDDIEAIFTVDGKEVDVEKIGELTEAAEKTGAKLDLDISQRLDEEAKPIKVTFRPLRAMDKTAIENTIQMEYGATSGQMAPGSMRRLAIKKAVVSWDYEVPFSENVLDNLDPSIFEQIYAWISWGSEPAQQNPETGLPIDPPTVKPNRAQRRATATKEKTTTKPTPVLAVVDSA